MSADLGRKEDAKDRQRVNGELHDIAVAGGEDGLAALGCGALVEVDTVEQELPHEVRAAEGSVSGRHRGCGRAEVLH